MSELHQTQRLQDAELTPAPELWKRLEVRIAAGPDAAMVVSTHRKKMRAVWYWAAAASFLLFSLWAGFQRQTNTPMAGVQPIQNEPTVDKQPSNAFDKIKEVEVASERNVASLLPNSCEQQASLLAIAPNTPNRISTEAAAVPSKGFSGSARASYKAGNTPAQAKETVMELPSGKVNPTLEDVPTVAEFNAPRTILPPIDSLKILSVAIGPKDSLNRLVASSLHPIPGRDSLRPAAKMAQPRKQTLLNKFNRALRWLPGGSAWPSIKFEKADVALANTPNTTEEPVF